MRRVCLLTGAGGVFGNAFCRMLARQYSIMAVHRSVPPLVATQQAELFDPVAPRRGVPESEYPVFAVEADLAQPAEVDRVAELALARFGQVDLLVNAAAEARVRSSTTDPDAIGTWERQLAVNTLVPVHLAAVLAREFWKGAASVNRAHGRNVVNISSTAGLTVAPYPERGFYGASKAALNILTAQMAAEYQPLGVRVNAVAPTSFPELLPTERVIRAVRQLDQGQMSGRILVMESERTRWI